jgi:SNF2 family DNA or RNA helicase
MLLRRTKSSHLDGKRILDLPPRHVQVEESVFNEDEREFYLSLFKKAQFQFNAYVKAGTVMKNYHVVLVWILRLRQACCHPSLIFERVDPDAEDVVDDAPKNADGTRKTSVDILLDGMSEDIVRRLIDNSVEKEDCAVCLDV